jgi:hypothetical protein
MKHPLINENSTHYNVGEKSAIELMEEKFTPDEMMAWAKINIFKYEYRMEHKGQKDSDLKKIETYERYLAFLHNLTFFNRGVFKTVKDLYKDEGKEIEYESITTS